jgi:hypothetical protein
MAIIPGNRKTIMTGGHISGDKIALATGGVMTSSQSNENEEEQTGCNDTGQGNKVGTRKPTKRNDPYLKAVRR